MRGTLFLLFLPQVVQNFSLGSLRSVSPARNLAAEHSHNPAMRGRGFFANQFETDAKWQAHYEGTGPEIYNQTNDDVDAFVAGAGTGGTISGVAFFLQS